MKRAFFAIMGLLVLGVLFVGCPTGGGTDPGNVPPTLESFAGTWTNRYGNHPTYTFTENQWNHTYDNGQNANGTFTFTDTEITFTPTSGSPWTQGYTLNSTTLSLENIGGVSYGNFTKGAYNGAGVWLVKDSDFYAYNTATNNFQNTNGKQPKPTGIARIQNITDSITTNFKTPNQNNPNYNEASCNGWYGFEGQGTNITIPAGNYYVSIVPMFDPNGNWNDGFSWDFDSSKIFVGNGGSTPTTITNTANPQTFSLSHFKNASEVFGE